MKRFFGNRLAGYGNQDIGLSFFLAWNYFSFFSCGLIFVRRILRGSERVWMWVGLFVALAALAVMLVSARRQLVARKPFGVAAALCASVGTVVVWAGFFSSQHYLAITSVGGMVAGAGFAMMAMVWGDRYSRRNEAAIEFAVPASFIISFAIYFVMLVLKGPVPVAVNAVLPFLSMYFAFRRVVPRTERLEPAENFDRRLGARELGRLVAGVATLCLLFGMLWFQFAFFRLLATPDMMNGRFLHYLLPFSSSFVLSIVALLSCITLSRFLNFTLMFRWGLPLLLLSYAVLYYDYDDPLVRIVAYTVNFIGMFGVQFTLWLAAPKYVRRTGMPPYVLFGGLLFAEGVGIFIGAGYGLVIVDQVTASNVMRETLFFFVALLLVAMLVGFNPRWAFRRVGEDQAPAGCQGAGDVSREGGPSGDVSVSDGISALFAQQADELREKYGLSQRETEVAELLLAGRSRPYIRDELVISLNTVHTHARNIYAKCGVHSQREFMDLPASLRDAGCPEGAKRDEAE